MLERFIYLDVVDRYMDWWYRIAMVSDRGRVEEIITKVYNTESNPMARTIAIRIISEKLFEKIGFPQRLKLIVDIEAMKLAKELNERLYREMPRKLRKMIDKQFKNEINPVVVIMGSFEFVVSKIKDEIDRITASLNLDVIDDPIEMLVYARDLTLYYYLEIMAISKVYHISEIDALKVVEFMIDTYLRRNDIQF